MRQLKKKNLLKYASNEYLAAVLAAKLARRLHAMDPEQRPKPEEKVTSLALELINQGDVEFEMVDSGATRGGKRDEGETDAGTSAKAAGDDG